MESNYAREWLEAIKQQVTCAWCQHPSVPVFRGGLCHHCYRIRLKVRRARTCVERYGELYELEFDVRVAEKAEQLAKDEAAWGNLEARSPLHVEHTLSWLSERFVKKDLYYGLAT